MGHALKSLKSLLPAGLLAATIIAGACSSEGGADGTPPSGGGGSGAAGASGGTGGDGGGGSSAGDGGGGSNGGGGEGIGGSGVTPSSGCGAASWTDSGGVTIDVDGTERYYRITLPDSYDSNTPYRVVFVWHGQGGDADTVADGYGGYFKYNGLLDLANDSAIFIAGQGLGAPSGWPDDNGQDIAFAEAILASVVTEYCVDEARVFSTGMSYGGIMSNRVGCEMGDDIRAIAPIMGTGPMSAWSEPPGSGNCVTYAGATCVGQVAAWISHGRNDNVVDFCLGELTRDYWQADNNCGTAGTPNGVGECVEYDGCDPAYPVVWCPSDEAHTPPDYADTAIWEFLSRF